MKSNAHFYLPWSVIFSLTASTATPLVRPPTHNPRLYEQLLGGCRLYRLSPPRTSSDPQLLSDLNGG